MVLDGENTQSGGRQWPKCELTFDQKKALAAAPITCETWGEDDAAEASRRLAALGLDLEGESGKWRIRDNTHRYLEGYAL